ncbi:hypothetical protein A3A20_02195 [Candidatus Wolfebacteria bacterium RIFCSPLOWO2_01_FULL_45_19]|uniref:MazG nucleotide pyrophosphohydrolase n=1 Tax=Candidatus Wolfebacteria bacterium RIFCSPLOWO2_01_FULL_45_19 TaxID=1802557 RepID=A0A1F8DSV7_9BACT|nr:MAG: hypothetical protein UX23_C0001G0077 [Parcubacteria group bacterium GW2011_GWB1_45_9]OGM91723.1 MAG: hypothetical protein A3A20_02195 [Candidatus Wolfebacteria bacterium RIFCSPLOWO2_01_FULL_45_19]
MKSVVICGSQRYKDEIRAFSNSLKALGVSIVFEPNFERRPKKFLKSPERIRLAAYSYRKQIPALVHEHFDRIRKADICYIYNKSGYLGVNTTLELGFAHGKNMIIYALEPEKAFHQGGEICRDILFTEVVPTPDELVKRLA